MELLTNFNLLHFDVQETATRGYSRPNFNTCVSELGKLVLLLFNECVVFVSESELLLS